MPFSKGRTPSFKVHNWIPLISIIGLCIIIFVNFSPFGGTLSSGYEEVDLEYIRTHHLTPYNPDQPTNYFGSRPAWAEHLDKDWKQTMSSETVSSSSVAPWMASKERLTKFKEIYSRKFQVQCYPLDMLMAAINRKEIDYFSLDVEGVELDILKTIPFDRIHIKLISVEVRPGNKQNIHEFLQSKGYKRVFELTDLGTEMMHDDLYELQT